MKHLVAPILVFLTALTVAYLPLWERSVDQSRAIEQCDRRVDYVSDQLWETKRELDSTSTLLDSILALNEALRDSLSTERAINDRNGYFLEDFRRELFSLRREKDDLLDSVACLTQERSLPRRFSAGATPSIASRGTALRVPTVSPVKTPSVHSPSPEGGTSNTTHYYAVTVLSACYTFLLYLFYRLFKRRGKRNRQRGTKKRTPISPPTSRQEKGTAIPPTTAGKLDRSLFLDQTNSRPPDDR